MVQSIPELITYFMGLYEQHIIKLVGSAEEIMNEVASVMFECKSEQ